MFIQLIIASHKMCKTSAVVVDFLSLITHRVERSKNVCAIIFSFLCSHSIACVWLYLIRLNYKYMKKCTVNYEDNQLLAWCLVNGWNSLRTVKLWKYRRWTRSFNAQIEFTIHEMEYFMMGEKKTWWQPERERECL